MQGVRWRGVEHREQLAVPITAKTGAAGLPCRLGKNCSTCSHPAGVFKELSSADRLSGAAKENEGGAPSVCISSALEGSGREIIPRCLLQEQQGAASGGLNAQC